MLTSETMKQKRNALPVARGIVGRRVMVRGQLEAVYTVKAITRKGDIRLDRPAPFIVTLKNKIPLHELAGKIPQRFLDQAVERAMCPPIMTRRRLVWPRCALKFVRRTYTGYPGWMTPNAQQA